MRYLWDLVIFNGSVVRMKKTIIVFLSYFHSLVIRQR